MIRKYIKIKKNIKGFSFVEALVSVFLVSVGLLAVLSLLSVGLRETMDSRNQVIASSLAQEGTEIVRSLRDRNWANNEESFYEISMEDNQALDYKLNASSDYKLKINSDGFYEQSSGSATKFSRKIDISSIDENRILVQSFVLWSEKLEIESANDSNCNIGSQCVYVEDILTRWGE